MATEDEFCCDWTFVNSDGELNDESTSEENFEQIPNENEEISSNDKVDVCLKNGEEDVSDCDSSSDIEKIEEPQVSEVENSSSEFPEFNIATHSTDEEENNETNNNQLFPVENLVDMHIERFASNRQTRNHNSNFILNILTSISLVLVIMYGVGYLIGFNHHEGIGKDEIDQAQINNLKLLQDELVTCLQSDLNRDDVTSSIKCYGKAKFWKQQFEHLLFENDDLQNILNLEETIQTKCDQELQQELEKLKLSLLYKQIEHVEALKQFEIIRKEEKVHREKVKELQEENEDLKLKLRSEESHDELDDEKLLIFLMKENLKFRVAFEESKSSKPGENIIQVEVDSLRQQINQLHVENEDLRQVIARLRYGRPYESIDKQNHMNQLKMENGELKMEIGKIRYSKSRVEIIDGGNKTENESLVKNSSGIEDLRDKIEDLRVAIDKEKNQTLKWKKMYESIKQNVNATTSPWKLMDLLHGTVGEMSNILEKSGVTLVKTFEKVVNTTNNATMDAWLSELWVNVNNNTKFLMVELQDRWEEVQRISGNKVVKQMNEVLMETASKVVDTVKSIDVKSTKKKAKKMIANVVDQFWNLMGKNEEKDDFFDDDQIDRKNVFIQEPKNGKPKRDDYKIGDFNNDGQENKADWMFLRAQFRKEKHEKQKQADWLFDRARDREELRGNKKKMEDDDYFSRKKKKGDRGEEVKSNWYFKKGKREKIKERTQKNRRYNQNREWKFERNKYERKSLRDRLGECKKSFSHESDDFVDEVHVENICKNKIRSCDILADVDQQILFGC